MGPVTQLYHTAARHLQTTENGTRTSSAHVWIRQEVPRASDTLSAVVCREAPVRPAQCGEGRGAVACGRSRCPGVRSVWASLRPGQKTGVAGLRVGRRVAQRLVPQGWALSLSRMRGDHGHGWALHFLAEGGGPQPQGAPASQRPSRPRRNEGEGRQASEDSGTAASAWKALLQGFQKQQDETRGKASSGFRCFAKTSPQAAVRGQPHLH